MDNWLLIIVGVIFLISIVAGYVRGLLKIGISLLATVLSIVLVMFLAPYVSDALIKWTPADEMIEEKCMEMFMPQISADTLKNADCGVSCYIYPCVDSCQGTDGCSRSDRRASDSGIFQSPGRSGCRSSGGTVDCLALVFDHNIIV